MSAATEALPRRQIGPYSLTRVIASGGFGTVHEAVGPDGQRVAVKILDQRVANEEEARRFAREAGLRLEHPNVIRVLDAGTEEGLPYIALELLEGGTLRDRLEAEGSLAARDTLRIAIQICKGLAAAHAEGVVHRDLKPENLFLCDDGTVKVLDFGIAFVGNRATRMTSTGVVLGTPSYLAPEQASGDRDLDERADIWALGVVLYECLAGFPPYERDTPLGTVLAILRDQHEPLLVRVPEVPPALGHIVERCLVRERADRWPTATALGEALEQADLSAGGLRTTVDFPTAQNFAVGEHRVVAVLLARGVLDPEPIRTAVERWGGTFLKVMGRRALGLFGGASWEGDELEYAALAALASRDSARSMAVAAGRAMNDGTGISGSALRAAERGCEIRLSGVAVDGRTARALGKGFHLEQVEDDLFRLGSRRHSSPLPPSLVPFGAGASMETVPPPSARAERLVGRDAELSQIRAALRRVLEEGEAQGMLVSGPAGIGKSRLRRALEEQAERALVPTRVIRSRANPLGRGTALGLLADGLRQRLRAGHRDLGWPPLDPDTPAEAQQTAIAELVREATDDAALAAECAPFLGQLLGVPMPPSPELEAARGDAQLMADRLRLSLRDYLGAILEQGPLVLILEDLQWADAASMEFVEQLLEQFMELPLLLFATARPWLKEHRPGFLEGPDVARMELRGLGAAEAGELAEHTAGEPLPDPVVRKLAERTGGNPLFIEQIVLEIRERGLLASDTATEIPLPLTVEAAVQSRLDHLPPFEKNLCKRAAILGRPFTEAELEGLGVVDAKGMLRSLRTRGIVAATQGGKRGAAREYRFRSALVADIAYTLLTEEAQKELHLRAARMMASALDADDEEVAHHYDRAGDAIRAAQRYVAATLDAARLGDSEKVLRAADRALELGFDEKLAFAVHMARAEALEFLGRFDEQSRALDEADRHVSTDKERAMVLGERVGCLWYLGKQDEAARLAEETANAARQAGDLDLEALAWARQATALAFQSGRKQEADVALANAEAVLRSTSPLTQGRVREARYALAHERGNFSTARASAADAARLYGLAGDLRRAARTENNLATVLNRVGAYDQAEAALVTVANACRRLGLRRTQAFAWLNIADARTNLGRADEALEALAAARSLAARMSSEWITDLVLVYEARAHLEAGHHEGVAETALRVAARAKEKQMPKDEVRALVVAARAELLANRPQDALRHSSDAMATHERTGVTGYGTGELYLTHGRALQACDNRSDAESVLMHGRELLLAEARQIEEPEWQQRFLNDVLSNRLVIEGRMA